MKSKSFLITSIAFAGMILSYVAMMIYGGNPKPYTYPNPAGMQIAMIYFELIKNPAELFLALGPIDSPQGKALRMVMDRINQIDFAFMVSYSILFFMYLIHSLNVPSRRAFITKNRSLFTGLALLFAGTMLIGDIVENLQLIALTHIKTVQDVPLETISALQLWTSLKWAAIFWAALFIAFVFSFSQTGLWRWPLVVVYFLTGIIGLAGMFQPAMRFLVEIASSLLAIAWLLNYIFIYKYYKRNILK